MCGHRISTMRGLYCITEVQSSVKWYPLQFRSFLIRDKRQATIS